MSYSDIKHSLLMSRLALFKLLQVALERARDHIATLDRDKGALEREIQILNGIAEENQVCSISFSHPFHPRNWNDPVSPTCRSAKQQFANGQVFTVSRHVSTRRTG